MNPHSASHETVHRVPAFAWVVLAGLGAVDLVRGVLHTFLVKYTAVEISGMNLAESGPDQLMLMGAFGISNFLTGALFLFVAWKAKELAPLVLGIIPVAYLLGILSFKLNHITPDALFPGRIFMLGYLAVCIVTFVASVNWRPHRRSQVGYATRG